WSICCLVINRDAAQGANISVCMPQIFSLISSKGINWSATRVLPVLAKNNCVISSKLNPSSFINPPEMSIIPLPWRPFVLNKRLLLLQHSQNLESQLSFLLQYLHKYHNNVLQLVQHQIQ